MSEEVRATKLETTISDLKLRADWIDATIQGWNKQAAAMRIEQTEILAILAKLEKPDEHSESEPIL